MEQRELTPEKKDKGFTLVELLIVIVILGILATVVVFAVAGVTEKAQGNACATTKKTLQTAIESYKAENALAADATVSSASLGEYLTDDWPDGWTINAYGDATPPPAEAANCDPE